MKHVTYRMSFMALNCCQNSVVNKLNKKIVLQVLIIPNKQFEENNNKWQTNVPSF